jgi:hypothetical protein
VRPVDIPYVYGGDGSTMCVPDRFVTEVRAALAATVAMAASSFDLTLRAAVVPLALVSARARDLLVARHRVSEHYVQCALFGGGAIAVERALKDATLPADFVIAADPDGAADYGGLECRWREIPSPAAETVALIVEGRGGSASSLGVYHRVMVQTRAIYGDADRCRPVVEGGLRVAVGGRGPADEARLKHGRRGRLARWRAEARLRINVALGWILLARGVRTEETDWSVYRRDLVANTDFRKFDGALRLVLAGNAAQRAELVAFLDGLRSAGEIAYGLHVSDSALMTCLIERRQGAHVHFIDAAGGGYAAAALDLKGS